MLLIELCSGHCWRLSSYIPDSIVDPDPYPDPDSIWGPWTRIRIRNPDPDPGGQKLPQKLINIIFRSAECSFLTAEGFSWSLNVF
jgi:hypothetical protein